MKKNNTSIAIVMFLMFAMVISVTAIPAASAQEPRRFTSYAVVGATPNPVGVGQETLIMLGITWPTMWPQTGWKNVEVVVTRPDGTTQSLGRFNTDTTGLTGTVFVPTMEGTYILQTRFPEQEVEVSVRGIPAGSIMEAGTSLEYELIVQADPILHHPGVPLPTEYWTRPIDAQDREWSAVSGSWLSGSILPSRYAPYNEGPETGHILWTKPLEMGGLIGGEFESLSFSHGDAYEGRFNNRIILGGVLFYNLHQAQGGTAVEQVVVAVDIRTGEELWRRPLVSPDGVERRLSHGQIMYWDTMNHHGAWPYLWAVVGSTWHAFSPNTGRWEYTMTGVPGGTNIYCPDSGAIIRYNVNAAQNFIQKWNSTWVVYAQLLEDFATVANPYYEGGRWRPQGRTFDAAKGIEWEVAIAGQPTGPGSRILPGAAQLVFLDDRIIGCDATAFATLSPDPMALWGVSVKPGDEGRLLFNVTWSPPKDSRVMIPGGILAQVASLEDGVFVLGSAETRTYFGISLDTGRQLWGPTSPPEPALNAYSITYTDAWGQSAVAYGKLFTGGMGGMVNAYDITTGEHLWSYRVTDPYNQQLLGDWPCPIAFITDGKIYVAHMEHSVIDPRPRGAPFVCLDVETGEEIFRIDGLRIGTRWGGQPLIADSVIIGFNTYDNQIYALGKGPSATEVTASPKFSVHGNNVLVEGVVTDVSPGTRDPAVAMRFPNGVPAVGDESMSEWMNYVYMQKPRPTDVVGVEVILSVLDPNNNYYEVGRTTADAKGFFKLAFEPLVPGEYTVIAAFEGSGAYYGSDAQTAISVVEASAVAEPTPPPASIADMYFIPAVIGIIVAIVVVGVILMLVLKKR